MKHVNYLPVIFAKETGVTFSHLNEHNNFGREYIPLNPSMFRTYVETKRESSAFELRKIVRMNDYRSRPVNPNISNGLSQ